MSTDSVVVAQKVVTLEYVLKNAEGTVLDSSEDNAPLSYLHGSHQIVPGLERALEGLKVGDKKEVVVQPVDGYGEPDPNGIFPVPLSAFPAELKLSVGDALMGEDDEGNTMPVRIVEVRADSVLVDANHPLAGQVLYYHVTIQSVREPTPEELTHGHVHNPGDEHDHDH
jgi:FKBP-type peptidyl-prolyl cis-trans isomerase SlyD